MKIVHAGYCVVCGAAIDWNINYPFCKRCKSSITSTPKYYNCDLIFCHGCGLESKNITVDIPLCKRHCRPLERDSISIDDIHIWRLNWYKQLKDIHSIWDRTPRTVFKIINDYCITDLLYIVDNEGLKTNDVFSNSISSNNRIMNTLWRWEFGLPISLPILDKDNNFFIDGRHRILAAYHLNEKQIPIYCKTEK